jgi:phosphoribosylformylglycinamidine synthase
MSVSPETLAELSLSPAEYEMLVERMGREPNKLELGMFGILWSEHCGYKHSKLLLRLFPREAPWVLIGPGEENAGAVSIGDGLCVIMKIESHNHPSAIEPYQGAATGVGGIIRDIFSMGARPIALLNALFFGPLDQARNRHLYQGVVAGVGGYGNCIGIPDVAGQVTFDPAYSGNPLVNAMCVGIAREDEIVRANTGGEGNLLLLVGSDTGRDGIHGATFASVDLTAESEQRRPAVQVGNPFMEKLLLEACLEVVKAGLLVGMQDLGAGGLTSAAVECAARAGTGVELDVSRVPRREEGMTPYEVMLSESQERMLLVVRPDQVEAAKAVFHKWDLTCEVVGRVIAGDKAVIKDDGEVVGEMPVAALTEPPAYRITGKEDRRVAQLRTKDLSSVPLPSDWNATLLKMVSSPTIGSKLPVYRRYDHQVGNNTVLAPGQGDAGVLRIKGTNRGIALTADVNSRACYLDPYRGGALAVLEAARNLSCVGARPLAITDCLNFGNPERGPIAYQLEQAIRGMADACRALGVPVISGNVSLYNESERGAIYPTPTVGMVGLLEDVAARCAAGFSSEGDAIYLIGAASPALPVEALGASEYLMRVHGTVAGRPGLDVDMEVRVQQLVREAIERGLLRSAHDASDGGVAVALAESCVIGGLGARVHLLPETQATKRLDATLFGEAPARVVVSVDSGARRALEALAAQHGVPLCSLGTVGGDRLRIGSWVDLPVAAVREAWSGALVSTDAATGASG